MNDNTNIELYEENDTNEVTSVNDESTETSNKKSGLASLAGKLLLVATGIALVKAYDWAKAKRLESKKKKGRVITVEDSEVEVTAEEEAVE